MVEPQHLRDLAWALNSVAELLLLIFLVRRGSVRSHPAFFFYLLGILAQSAGLFCAYRYFSFNSATAWAIAWSSQGFVTCARWFAGFEIAQKVLSPYSGIWGLAKRVLFVISATALASSLFFWRLDWRETVMSAERGLNFAIASFIVLFLLFARYYRVPLAPLERTLALGFFLYSCFSVLNYSVFEMRFRAYSDLWNFLDMLFFLATVLIWTYAVRTYSAPQTVASTVPISRQSYEKLAGELNLRLRSLNQRLSHVLRSEDPRT